MTSGGNNFNDFPKLYQPQKSRPKNREDFSFSRPWPWTYFLNGLNAAASIAPTLSRHIDAAARIVPPYSLAGANVTPI